MFVRNEEIMIRDNKILKPFLYNPFEQHIRLGLTGLSRSGKTVFLTSLIHNLLTQKNLPLFTPLRDGLIENIVLQHQPNDAIARFAYEEHLDCLLADPPRWPEGTKNISQIRLSIRYRPQNIIAQSLNKSRVLTLDIIDYPGEWLLDLPLLDMDFHTWSTRSIALSQHDIRYPYAKEWLEAIRQIDLHSSYDNRTLTKLAQLYTDFLLNLRKAGKGHFDLPPGRFLLAGDLKDAPVLTFCPLPSDDTAHYPKNSYGAVMQRRFESYKKLVVQPFFEKYFAKLDQQIVLIDPLSALNQGEAALKDLSYSMESILDIVKPKASTWLYRLLLGRNLSHVLFAATKADHVHHSQHENLLSLTKSLIPQAYQHVGFSSVTMDVMAIAALRCTTELMHKDGRQLVSGYVENEGTKAIYPGEVPVSVRKAKEQQYGFKSFMPPNVDDELKGFEHIRLDQVLDFLLKEYIQ